MASDEEVFRRLRVEIGRLRAGLSDTETRAAEELAAVATPYRASAINLLDYLTVRQVDLRPVQLELYKRGLSSLGRMEGHVRDSLDQVLARLDDALGSREPRVHRDGETTSSDEAERLLHRHTRDLFGSKPQGRHVYVMVTAPDAVEVDEHWAEELVARGTNIVRVNGAHEGEAEWDHIVRTVRKVGAARGASIRVLVDLPGPKIRTVAPCAGEHVERWRPERDAFGRVTAPRRILLHASTAARPKEELCAVAVSPELLSRIEAGDEVFFVDARAKKRRFVVAERTAGGAIGHLGTTAYVVPGTVMVIRRGPAVVGEFTVSEVAERPFRLSLSVGDRFRLEPLPDGEAGSADELPLIGCSFPAVVSALELGARVLFDDGKLETIVHRRTGRGVVLRVTHSPDAVFHLRAEKGINVPDTHFEADTLGPDDERALAFAVRSADVVGASFIRSADDVRRLYRRLDELSAARLGVVLKIETAPAFKSLPAILLAAMARHPVGVMIARGDLAVEVGFERLAELQEEILWLCEASHLPVIWATQVLDRLAHTGSATRAEVTDAAMGVRAECVMLNKGPHITAAVSTLVDILQRMEHHQYKKRSLYRRLALEVPAAVSLPAHPVSAISQQPVAY
jgi:pyruvate kinase